MQEEPTVMEFAYSEILPPKQKIVYHKSYRKLMPQNSRTILSTLLLSILLPDLVIFLFFPQITQTMAAVSRWALSQAVPAEVIQTISREYFHGRIYFLSLPGHYPSRKLAIIMAIIFMTFLFVIFYWKKVIDPKWVWVVFISFICLVSALFFTFFSVYFPYDIEIFSEMYYKTEIGVWLIIPFILSISLLPLPASFRSKTAAIYGTLLYSIAFACIRYIVFLYLLRSISYLFMPLMFFVFGPFLDFVYVVSVYSLFTSRCAEKHKSSLDIWQWSY